MAAMIVKGTLRFSPGAVTDLAAWQGFGMVAFVLALVEGHRLCSSVDK